jgi:hypothetical protein
MALQKRCWQVHSAVTPKVGVQKQRKGRPAALGASPRGDAAKPLRGTHKSTFSSAM